MSRLATVLIVLAAIGLAVFVGTTTRWRFSPDRLATVGSPLFRFDPSEIHGIKIKNGDTTYTLEQSGEGWRISNGATTDEASPAMVRALLQAALESPILDRIDASEVGDDKKLSTFGVSKSSLQIDFLGDRPGTLLIGKSSPDNSRTYVSFKHSNTIHLVPKSFTDLVSIDPAAFRERKLLTIDPATVEHITLRSGPSLIELKRNGSTWHILKPVRDQADPAAVQRLLDAISQTAIQSFSGKKNTGEALDFSGSIELRSLATDAPILISLTRPNESGIRSVELQPRNISGLLPPSAPDLLAIDLDLLRDRALARVNPDMVDLVKIKTPRSNLAIHRNGDTWQPTTVNIDDLVKTLASTRVSSYRPATPAAIQETSLADPPYRIEFTALLSENTPEALAGEHPVLGLSIGPKLPDATVPVLITGSPEIRFVPATFLDALDGL